MKNSVEKFIEKNKDKLTVNRNSQGNVISIESNVPTNELDFYGTDCKLNDVSRKQYISTLEGNLINFSIKRNLKESTKNAFGKVWSTIKIETARLPQDFKDFSDSIKDYYNKKKCKPKTNKPAQVEKPVEKKKPILARSTPVGDYYKLEKDVNNLINGRLDALFKLFEKDEKYSKDPTIIRLKQDYESLKARFELAKERLNTSEILNVKTKMVKISGQLISVFHKLEGEEVKEMPSTKENESEVKEGKTGGESTHNEAYPFVILPSELNQPPKSEPIVTEPTVKEEQPPKSEPIVTEPTVKEEQPPKSEPTVIPPVVKEEQPIVKSDYELNKKSLGESEANKEKCAKVIENINLDKRSIEKLEDEVKILKESGLKDMKDVERLKQLEEDITFFENRIKEFRKDPSLQYMNQKVPYYKDGKVYKEVSRWDVEKYLQNADETNKRREEYELQEQLKEERKQLLEEQKKLMERQKRINKATKALAAKINQNQETLGKMGINFDEDTIEMTQEANHQLMQDFHTLDDSESSTKQHSM